MVFSRQTQTLIIAILFFIVLISTVITIIGFNTPKILQEKVYFAKGEIGEKAGIAVDSSVVNFGRITQYGASQKEIEVTNSFNETVKVYVFVYGEIAEMVEVRPVYKELKPQEKVKLIAQFSSGNHSLGNYTGNLRVVISS